MCSEVIRYFQRTLCFSECSKKSAISEFRYSGFLLLFLSSGRAVELRPLGYKALARPLMSRNEREHFSLVLCTLIQNSWCFEVRLVNIRIPILHNSDISKFLHSGFRYCAVPIFPSTDILEHWYFGIQILHNYDISEFRHSRNLILSNRHISEYQHSGLPIFWNSVIPTFRNFKTPISQNCRNPWISEIRIPISELRF